MTQVSCGFGRRIVATILTTFVAYAITASADDSSETPLFHVSFDEGMPKAHSRPTVPGVAQQAMQLASDTLGPRLTVDGETGEAYTVSLWLRVDRYPDGGAGYWTDDSPMTVVELHTRDRAHRAILRLHRRQLQLAHTHSGGWETFTGHRELAAGHWYHIALSRSGSKFQLFVNGRLDAEHESPLPSVHWRALDVGRFGEKRRLLGSVDELRLFGDALPAEVIQQLIRADGGIDLIERVESVTPTPTWNSYGRYPALQVRDDVSHPLIDQLFVSATVVPWTGAGATDLLVRSVKDRFFGARLALFRQIGTDERGLPLYDTGETLTPLPGRQFQTVRRNDRLFDLFAIGAGTPYGDQCLIQYANKGEVGKPRFGDPQPVYVDGETLGDVVEDRFSGWWIGQVDDDSLPDLLVTQFKSRPNAYWPDQTRMWSGKAHPNAGPGRGYDIQGKWLGDELTTSLWWAKGQLNDEGMVSFEGLQKVHYRHKGFAVQWRAGETQRAVAALRLRDGLYVIHTGSVDQILAMPATYRDGELICYDARPLLAGGTTLRDTYFPLNITVCDVTGDGEQEILLDGNPGRVTVLKGNAVGQFRELGSLMMRGGPLAVDTLATPCRIDWDGDGRADLIVGDSSGWLTFWPGTDDPYVYGAPRFMRAGDQVIHHQAGMTGSIQGPNERRWGYLQPTVGDWDEDGSHEIITNDISGRLMLYRRASSAPEELEPPLTFSLDEGQPLPAAWRARPAIIPADADYRGTARPCLLHLDWNGDLAVAVPAETGGTRMDRVDKLRYEDASVVRLSGPAGFWGRTKLSVADWDEDGDWDVVLGTNRGVHRFFMQSPPPAATPLWLQNVGTSTNPRFRRPQPIRLQRERLIDLGVHNASVWPTDLDADGHLDLIIGAEDGKVYWFLRKDLEW